MSDIIDNMADFVKGLFGGAKPSVGGAVPSADSDFADFADAPSPTPASLSSTLSAPPAYQTFGAKIDISDRPFTKWYNVHERVTWSDFKTEGFVIPFLLLTIFIHFWGVRSNRRRANAWIRSHVNALENEFTHVGFGKKINPATVSPDVAMSAGDNINPEILREKSKDVFLSYATGRQNVACVDVKLSLLKRYNPFSLISELGLGFFFESMAGTGEKAEITITPFDGKEAQYFRVREGEEKRFKDTSYDGFIFAIVNKDAMRKVREERYDVSLTTTKDHAKLPPWVSVMSESAEVTEMLLTQELANAIKVCGDDLESLIVTDLPVDAPRTLDELVPKKRVVLTLKLNSGTNTTSLFSYFLRMPDQLVTSAHFRPEVMRRIRQTREEEAKKVRKIVEAEGAEDRKLLSDKAKKEQRDRKLKGMSADEQKRFLEREREKDMRKRGGRQTMRA
ncbi:DUF1682-domain-containing protein [Aureobasidium pullulans]|nr:DUF1682-domain-containing protein [Aureobasidium pullulans]